MEYKYEWDLNKYFYDNIENPQIKKDLNDVIEKLKDFIKKYKWNIKNFKKEEELLSFYKDDENISIKLNNVFHFLFYKNSLNTQDQQIIKKMMEVENMFIEIQNKLIFIDEEFKSLWKEKLIEFANSPKLENFKYYLLEKAEWLKYLLSGKEEKLLNEYSTVDSQIENLYSEFHNGLVFKIDWKQLTEEEVRSMRASKDPEKRRKAYKSLREKYDEFSSKTVLSNIYSAFVKNWQVNIKVRGYKTVMEPRNKSENMKNEVVDLLMEQVIEHYPLFQRYIDIKAKLLWINLPLPIQDAFAPAVESKTNITKQQAIEIYLNVAKNFDKDFYNYSVDLLKNGRVDFDVKKWKSWWAFASYSKWQESFVLLNFTWKLNDVSTLAHEFWHAIHGHLSQAQPEQTYDSPLSLAETASIFNEMLLSEYLFNDEKLSKQDKIALLENKLQDIFATIFRQIQYVDFERTVHKNIKENKQYWYEDYCKLWRNTQNKMSWDTIKYDVSEEKENGWSMIPHIFHTPFYCYSYAFWNILTFSLYEQYKQKWKAFIQDYKNILKSWGSTPPKELLLRYGIDISKKEFYENAFKQIKNMLDKLEKLVG